MKNIKLKDILNEANKSNWYKVGTFDENDLKNKKDKIAIKKAEKKTGLKYIRSKMIKIKGKQYMEVYLIPNEEYYSSGEI
jgi:uncharacterized protein YjdB